MWKPKNRAILFFMEDWTAVSIDKYGSYRPNLQERMRCYRLYLINGSGSFIRRLISLSINLLTRPLCESQQIYKKEGNMTSLSYRSDTDGSIPQSGHSN